VLSLKSNNLHAAGGKALAEGLKGNQVITELDISSNNLAQNSNYGADTSGIIALADAIPDMRALSVLSLKSNKLSAAGGKALAEGLKGNQVITELNIADNNLANSGYDMSGVIALADAIPDMGALSSVNLLQNLIGIDQAKALASILKEHPTLKSLCGNSGDETELDMSGKGMDAGAAIMLVPEIVDNEALSKLNLAKNSLGAVGAKAVAEALKAHEFLAQIDLQDTGIPEDIEKEIQFYAALNNKSLSELNASGVLADADGFMIAKVVSCIKANKKLRSIDLSSNKMTGTPEDPLLKVLCDVGVSISTEGSCFSLCSTSGTPSLVTINLEGNKLHPALLNAKFKSQDELNTVLEEAGYGTNALAGGEFKSKPIKSNWSKLGLLWSISSGYADLFLDVQVTAKWLKEGKQALFALSVACMLLPVMIQWAFVDKSVQRGALTFFQLKLAVDGWNSFLGGLISPG
jgi:hypothetical protein